MDLVRRLGTDVALGNGRVAVNQAAGVTVFALDKTVTVLAASVIAN
ncbi:hypothetical protein N579_08955 [Corynebacterium pseudodiphtheriticum 090104]|nr:hypothetical protein N579_08955 [Corynebacterium pseudodiphtheriticum 090104]